MIFQYIKLCPIFCKFHFFCCVNESSLCVIPIPLFHDLNILQIFFNNFKIHHKFDFFIWLKYVFCQFKNFFLVKLHWPLFQFQSFLATWFDAILCYLDVQQDNYMVKQFIMLLFIYRQISNFTAYGGGTFHICS